MANIQLSLFGKTLEERFLQTTGWTLEPCWNRSQTPKFQCLLLENGLEPAWLEGEQLMCAGDLWTPSIGENPPSYKEENASLSWQILEDNVPQKYFLKPINCDYFLRLSQRSGCPLPKEIEYLLIKQGGKYQSCVPLRNAVSEGQKKTAKNKHSSELLENQMTLFQLF